jgi:hypothetical protein
MSLLASTISQITNGGAASLNAQIEADFRANQQARGAHMNRVSQLERDITQEHGLLANRRTPFKREHHKHVSQLEHRLGDSENELTDSVNEHKAGCRAIVTFYAEREAALAAHLNAMKMKWDERPSRQSDQELIEKLSLRLQTVKIQLGTLLTNYKHCRALLIEQDGTYNRQFGCAPAVGVFMPRCSLNR